ncbi:MAG TPA: hypothetical protein PKE21_01975 [Flavobacteriales bacterium]|nr:hypothetical protein [Flavobacteriales bacterium]HMR26222.1 hypothetical protein [Flavobacteriales bacterium]
MGTLLRAMLRLAPVVLLAAPVAAQWVDWSNQYPYPVHRVVSHLMHRTSDGNLLLCGSIHGTWTPGSGIPFEDWAIATYLVKVQPTGDTLWTRRLDLFVPSSISHVVDLIDGNTLIAGTAAAPWTYCGFANANGPMPQLFALKIDQAGNVLWWHQYDQPCSRILADAWESPAQEIHLLALDTQEPNIQIGDVQPNWFEHHTLDAQGNTLSVNTFQQTYHYFTAQTGTASFDGGRYIAASALDTVGQNNLFIQLEKLDQNGTPQGAVFVTDTSYCTPADLITTLDSGLLMLMPHEYANSRLVHVDSLGNIIWDKRYGMRFERVVALPDTTYLAVGRTGGFAPPGLQLTVTCISAVGDSLWTRMYGDSLNDRGSSIELTPTGFVAYGTKDMYSGSVPPRLFLTWDTLGLFTGFAPEAVLPTMQVFPLPADERVCVRWAATTSGTHRLLIMDALGRTLRDVRMSRGNEQWIEVRDLANGCYFIQMDGAERSGAARFLIQR